MEQAQLAKAQTAEGEISHLHQQLQMRDQLVDQLSYELFRVLRSHPPALPPSGAAAKTTSCYQQVSTTSEADGLRQELREIEKQIEFYQGQIDKRDAEIARLRKSCQTLSERNQLLEHMIQDLPRVYRQKFSERLDQVKTKVQSLEQENHRLYSELQSIEEQQTPGKRHPKQLPLPSFGAASHRQ